MKDSNNINSSITLILLNQLSSKISINPTNQMEIIYEVDDIYDNDIDSSIIVIGTSNLPYAIII
ncbi:hypothetical protein D3C81_2210570 [compost metagenome]